MDPRRVKNCPENLLGPFLQRRGLMEASWSGLGGLLVRSTGILERLAVPFLPQFRPPFLAQTGWEPFPTSFFRLLRPLRALQEILQRISEGLRVEDAIWNQFWTGSGSDFGGPGPLQIKVFVYDVLHSL